MLCKLCLLDRPLCNSHIIPEFLYRAAYDDKGRALELTRTLGNHRFVQKGYRERLLCDECEQRINVFEKYFKQAWYDAGTLPDRVDEDVYVLQGLDYRLFKLFHLSVLWRAGVSSNSIFANVRLGAHREPMREILLSEDPGPKDRYHFLAQVLVDDGLVVDGVILEPATFKYQTRRIHVLLFGGCAWNYVISRQPLRDLLPLALTTSGTLPLLRQQITRFDLLADFLVDYVRSRKEHRGRHERPQ
jgi:hypothetical protein